MCYCCSEYVFDWCGIAIHSFDPILLMCKLNFRKKKNLKVNFVILCWCKLWFDIFETFTMCWGQKFIQANMLLKSFEFKPWWPYLRKNKTWNSKIIVEVMAIDKLQWSSHNWDVLVKAIKQVRNRSVNVMSFVLSIIQWVKYSWWRFRGRRGI